MKGESSQSKNGLSSFFFFFLTELEGNVKYPGESFQATQCSQRFSLREKIKFRAPQIKYSLKESKL